VKRWIPVVVLLVIGVLLWMWRAHVREQVASQKPRDAKIVAPRPAIDAAVTMPTVGQARPAIERAEGAGIVRGRVVNWSTGEGVAGADLTFLADGGATTVHSLADGVFELSGTGTYVLNAASAPGFLPYAPELGHAKTVVELRDGLAVSGITVFLFPAIDYEGQVTDARGAPVAGAKVRIVGTPRNEQAIDKLDTQWTTNTVGTFTFHAADGAVLEATKGNARGWAVVNGDVQLTHRMTISLMVDATRDLTIAGSVRDAKGPLANVLVSATPDRTPGTVTKNPTSLADPDETRAPSFAITDAKGAFTLTGLDGGQYEVRAELAGYAPVTIEAVGGTRDVAITLDAGATLVGNVAGGGSPVAAFTLLVFAKQGTILELVSARSIVDAQGHFEEHVPPGTYDVQAFAAGWAPSERVTATAGGSPVELKVTEGATLSGKVVGADGKPISYARITREGRGGGASTQPANAGTVTRGDGTFELTGIPPGPFSITIGAGGFHPKIEAGMTASDGEKLGPITITLVKLNPGETPKLELVGIGVKLSGQKGDVILVEAVIPGGGAEAAGIVAGDQIFAVDGIEVTKLGLDGAVAKIRGVEGTTLALTLRREGKLVPFVATRRKIRA
jgi:protocatechuate 3,4-dioxygenase beta subunit